ncbi:leucyl aminopeptidase [Neokomagataea anthophila]|uniref:Probable cytosol aminopeptidase n=1 Tax=Neokomagataea anthophila TaxID=2826925 RepID=A0ABS5E5H9_9PROT|nr:leucyl aminopeptidase [Neokomagataea anthophila]MBR0559066.1 leucyl aminopeptidase [Neokomagataea anthophila]
MLDVSFVPSLALDDATPRAVAFLCASASPEDLKSLDALCGGAVLRAVAQKEFCGDVGQVLSLVAPSPAFTQLVLVGAAEKGASKVAATGMEQAGAAAVRALEGVEDAVLMLAPGLEKFAPEAALGAVLGAYSFTAYRTKNVPKKVLARVDVVADDAAAARWADLNAVGRGVSLARDLVNEPANVLNPVTFADRIVELEEHGLKVEVLDEQAMAELGFGALLGVAQGSATPPRLVIMRHDGGGDEAPLAFVGKGVTFDSGGISIKPAAGMDEMKADMGGAAAVVGLLSTLAQRKAKVNAIGVVGLVENMVSGTAQRPGDVVMSHSGQTIEVLNTDAEGRLVLADALSYTKERFDPRVIVNLATLTGAIVVSLGTEHAGLFSNNDGLAAALAGAGTSVDEKLWRMPMGAAYDKQIDTDIADMKNIGGRPGSAILAACFLQRFVGKTAWAHLDIAGTAYKSKAEAVTPKGATGFGVRLLDRYVRDLEAQG